MKIVIVDYGLGNLFSIRRAINFLGEDAAISGVTCDIVHADKVILPGVGAFESGINSLKEKKIDSALREYVKQGKDILGICLGMQLLMSSSEEFGHFNGLNLIDGQVIKLASSAEMGQRCKIPHVGWSKVFSKERSWEGTILGNNSPGDYFYFVHSYRVVPQKTEHILALSEYANVDFCAVLKKENIYGCQFHPEVSGEHGLTFLKRFLYGA